MTASASKRPTIADVARAAGVSPGTVSHALNGGDKVGERTRLRIQQLANELGYQPSVRAQRLRKGRSQSLALFSSMPPAISAGAARLGFFTELAVGCAEAALTRGYSLVLTPPAGGEAALRMLDIDAAILLEPLPEDPLAMQLQQRGIPYVTVGDDVQKLGADTVPLHHERVAALLLGHLRERGARRIGLILGSALRPSQAAFRELAESADDVVRIAEAREQDGEESGYREAKRLLREHPDLDALCVPVDAFASGAVRAAAESGRRVGSDLLLCTRYDGLRARVSVPALTAVDLHLNDVSHAAIRAVLDLLGQADPTPSPELPMPVLVPRDSTRGSIG